MIIDKIDNFDTYPYGEAWKVAFDFLKTLNADSEDKKYTLQGDDVFAIVMSYQTFSPEKGMFESHRDYIDIQTVILGSEGFECDFSDDLTVETAYDKSADIAFYKRSRPGVTRVDIFPGAFVMLYPHDAHLPGLIVADEARMVKKVVVKIRKELLNV